MIGATQSNSTQHRIARYLFLYFAGCGKEKGDVRVVDCPVKVPKILEALRGILALRAVKSLENAILCAWQDAGFVHIIDNKLHIWQQVHEPAMLDLRQLPKPILNL
jgi:hypothetical protein